MGNSKNKILNIAAVFIGVIPVYVYVILDKLSGNQEYTLSNILGVYFGLSVLSIGLILILDRYLLKESVIRIAFSAKTILSDVTIAFILITIVYLLDTIGAITYYRWIPNNAADKTEIINTIRTIFENPFYTALFLGPVIWAGQIFLELSRVFLLENLWQAANNKIWQWFIIILAAGFISLVNIDNGTKGVIFAFLTSLLFNITYYKYRRILPLIIASIIYQLIPLVNFAIQ